MGIREWWHDRVYYWSTNRQLLRLLLRKVDRIMATQAEITQALTDAKSTLDKVAGETGALIIKIGALEAVIAAGPALSQELQDAVAAVVAQANAVDALCPDPTP